MTGKVNPSGKLPFTFPASLNDSPAHALNAYPGENLQVNYKEGILVGYRWFDTKKIEPLYCFGYGLSYTNFKYTGLITDKKSYKASDIITATVIVNNAGKYAGKETVQLYVGKTGSVVERADKELKAFKKTAIGAGATAKVILKIPVKDLAYFDVKTKSWVVESGQYKMFAGTSSKDITQISTITVN